MLCWLVGSVVIGEPNLTDIA